MARIFWVAAENWGVWRNVEWQEEFRKAATLTYAKLPKGVKEKLALPAKEHAKLVAARRKLLAAKADGKKSK